MILVKEDSRGRKVVDIQTKLLRLGYEIGLTGVDGFFGPETTKAVKKFQSARSINVDGVVGPDTWREIVEATYRLGQRQLYLREPPFRGDDVREVQATLNNLGFNAGRVNGIFGSLTDKAVREFQKNCGLQLDGIVGNTTVEAMDKLNKRVSSGGITGVWDRNGLKGLESELFERRIAIVYPPDDASKGITKAFADLLTQEGAKIFELTQGDEADHADKANELDADILVLIGLNKSDDNKKRGSTCFYFDNGEYFSSRSKQIAQMIQSQLNATLDLFNNGVVGRNYILLRATKMPAVIVRPGYASNEGDKKEIQKDGFEIQVAKIVVDGLRCYWQD